MHFESSSHAYNLVTFLADVTEEVSPDTPVNGVKNAECGALLQQEVDNVAETAKTTIPNGSQAIRCTNNSKKSDGSRNVTLCIPSTTSQVEDWCILDCMFGVPLFDTKLNYSICNSIVQDGLWLCDRYVLFHETFN